MRTSSAAAETGILAPRSSASRSRPGSSACLIRRTYSARLRLVRLVLRRHLSWGFEGLEVFRLLVASAVLAGAVRLGVRAVRRGIPVVP